MKSLPKIPAMFRFRLAEDSELIVLRVCVIDGKRYNPGDPLDPNSGIRRSPRRLETLCRRRMLTPLPQKLSTGPKQDTATAPVKPKQPAKPKKTAETPVAEKEPAPVQPKKRNYHSLTKQELQQRLKKRGLPHRGRRDVLIARLEAYRAAQA